MKKLLTRIAIISGILAMLSPIVMVVLWGRYVREQEQLQGSQIMNKKECEPYNMTLNRGEDGKYRISWQTKEQCATFLLLGQTYNDFANTPYKLQPTVSGEKKNEYMVILQKQDELLYKYALVTVDGEWFGINGHPFLLKN